MAKKVSNANLNAAKVNQKDEFYTQIEDIAAELKHYKDHFRGKTVLCNCDDPYESNFFQFFALKFNEWGLKKLICTSYNGSPIAGSQLSLPFEDELAAAAEPAAAERKAYKLELTEMRDFNGDGAIDLGDVRAYLQQCPPPLLRGTGDFRSLECEQLLDEADIVCTNPPFSLFREYVAQLVKHDKKFLIIGNQNSITCKEIFPLIKENKMWLGVSMDGRNHYFQVPDNYPLTEKSGKIVDGKKFAFVKAVVWLTNLDHHKRHESLDLIRPYSPEAYPKYDNYDAINVDKVADIPKDYDGVMGVPITFLHKYCPEQFEILGNEYDLNIPTGRGYVNGNRKYGRIFIRKKALIASN